MTYIDRLAIGRPLRASISITRYILSICFLNIFVESIIDFKRNSVGCCDGSYNIRAVVYRRANCLGKIKKLKITQVFVRKIKFGVKKLIAAGLMSAPR